MEEKAIFALGCFWEPDDYFSRLKGVVKTRVGYTGGTTPNPTYQRLGDHTESVEITFNPAEISYKELLEHFWKQHDPIIQHKRQYMSAIFTNGKEQMEQAKKSLEEQQKKTKRLKVTQIIPVSTFYEAEEYHQKYFQKTGIRTC